MSNEIRLVYGRYVISLPVDEFLFTGMWPQEHLDVPLNRVVIPTQLYQEENDSFYQQVRGMLLSDSVRIEWDDTVPDDTIPVTVVGSALEYSELRRGIQPQGGLVLRRHPPYINTSLEEPLVEDIEVGRNTDTMNTNVGGSDYAAHKIQPWDIWDEYNLNPYDADIIKRILRTKSDEDTLLDYQKIQHICQKRIDDIESGNDPWGQK